MSTTNSILKNDKFWLIIAAIIACIIFAYAVAICIDSNHHKSVMKKKSKEELFNYIVGGHSDTITKN